VLDRALLRRIHASHQSIAEAVAATRERLAELLHRLRGDRPLPDLTRRAAIIVDDGPETGYRALAAARMLRKHDGLQIIVAVPVCSPVAEQRIGLETEVVYLECPADFATTAGHYEDFTPVSRDEAVALLGQAHSFAGDLYGAAEINGIAP
jgi:predicted phosphoribosyltransferase